MKAPTHITAGKLNVVLPDMKSWAHNDQILIQESLQEERRRRRLRSIETLDMEISRKGRGEKSSGSKCKDDQTLSQKESQERTAVSRKTRRGRSSASQRTDNQNLSQKEAQQRSAVGERQRRRLRSIEALAVELTRKKIRGRLSKSRRMHRRTKKKFTSKHQPAQESKMMPSPGSISFASA